MLSLTKFKKIASIHVRGGLAWCNLYNVNQSRTIISKQMCPKIKWNDNWDRRGPESRVQPPESENDRTRYENEIDQERKRNQVKSGKFYRHLYLIRFGEYKTVPNPNEYSSLGNPGIENDIHLTDKGQRQAGKVWEVIKHRDDNARTRRKEIHYGFEHAALQMRDRIGYALENVKRIQTELVSLRVKTLPPPEPNPMETVWDPSVSESCFKETIRMEAAFRYYFQRNKSDEENEFIIVADDNFIRYFLCRVMQVPPEGYNRMKLNHASISRILIDTAGYPWISNINDIGHIAVDDITE